MEIPSFEYDTEKNRRNIERHGISFEAAQELWIVPHVILQAKSVKQEERFMILGILNEQVYMAVFSWRNGRVRLISSHRAAAYLCRVYRENLNEKKKG